MRGRLKPTKQVVWVRLRIEQANLGEAELFLHAG